MCVCWGGEGGGAERERERERGGVGTEECMDMDEAPTQ